MGFLRKLKRYAKFYESDAFPKLGKRKTQIRLLHLQPGPNSSTGPRVAGKLVTASLDAPPKYEALSYVWGDPDHTVPITVNGTGFPTTYNLHLALERLVLPDRVRIVWVDAVCINQADLEERAEQVSQMRYIYQKAQRVLAFLGSPFDGVNLAIDYLLAAAKSSSTHVQSGLVPYLSVGGLDASSSDLSCYLIKFFRLPWWTRMWTVQEFILAREVVFYCGEFTIDAAAIVLAVQNILRHCRSCCQTNEMAFSSRYYVDDDDKVSRSVWNCLGQVTSLYNWSPGSTMLYTLVRFRKRQSTDPRDKIYAMLGLFPQHEDLVQLDYASPVEKIYEDFTIAYVDHLGDADILNYLGGARRLPNLPSFCPDWTIEPGDEPHNCEDWMMAVNNRATILGVLLDACLGSPPTWRRLRPGAVAVNGFLFDEICEVRPEQVNPEVDAVSRRSWLKEIQELAGVIEHETEKNHLWFLRALCGDMVLSATRPGYDSIDKANAAAILEQWWKWAMAETVTATYLKDIQRVHRSIQELAQGRSFVLTRLGYIGYADMYCQPGDYVGILGGGRTPFILRSAAPTPAQAEQPCYTVVGDAHIHGVMHGEAFQIAKRPVGHFDTLILV